MSQIHDRRTDARVGSSSRRMRLTTGIAAAILLLGAQRAYAQSSADTSAVRAASLSGVMKHWRLSVKDTVRVSPYFYDRTLREAIGPNSSRLPVAAEAVGQASPRDKGVSELVSDEVIQRCNRGIGDCLRANGRNIVFWSEKPGAMATQRES